MTQQSRDTKTLDAAQKRVYIETLGCQMNKSDSEHMMGLLDEIGYVQTDSVKTADLMILNTCAIRGGAEDKMFSYLGHWREVKQKRPGTLIAVGGCVAQERGADLIKRSPGVDIVFGTHNLHRLPELVLQAKETRKPVVELYQELPDDLPETPVIRQNDLSAWVSIIYGCDYNCTYCIVPYVRGREKSRQLQQIMQEVRELETAGYKEITFLGQNVTAYGHDLDPALHLGHLLEQAGTIDGIQRVRFLTGHPRDLRPEIIDAVASVWNACENFHIPIQSGSDRTLRRMARGYNTDFYRAMVDRIREKMPEASITSDFIAGFPGETERDFMETVNLIEEIGFDFCNTAAYSPRPHTVAANWEPVVPEDEKYERLRFLNSLVQEVAHKQNKRQLGRTVEVLVEGRSERNPERLTGRTRTAKIVNFEGPISLIGQLVDVHVDSASPWALRGSIPVRLGAGV
jgi:tRNA-2-methylthio-N6-dimethylallyladenosine synthase